MNTRSTLIIASLGLLPMLGCGNSTPQFSNRQEFHELEPFAQEYVGEVLETYFGTPTESVAWEKLPLKFHYADTTVAGEPTGRKVQFSLTDAPTQIGSGTEVVFLTAEQRNLASARIREWDAETRTATFETKLANIPSTGASALIGPGAVLKDGRMLYAEHCQHCHGVSGDGAGPTAQYLNPRPRDYRLGKFKFTTTKYEHRAQRGDLARVIEEGIPGTYMPSFKLLEPAESEAIVEYVMWLSMRGELEYVLTTLLKEYASEYVAQRVADGESYEAIRDKFLADIQSGGMSDTVQEQAGYIAEAWAASQTPDALVEVKVKRIPSSPESIARGRQLFLDANIKCSQCHGEAGYGNGPQTYSMMPDADIPGLFDDWGNPIKPRNLHTGIFRGGRRPYDLFCRIRASVKGTPMTRLDALPDEDVWHLVNYVYSIPYEEEIAGAGKEAQAAAPAEAEPVQPEKEVASN
ncbi:MAG: c-type cytochrome [Planctomycetaceae bacterium]|nr:c-type cytochrome [Planctomycetaceae bacterium]